MENVLNVAAPLTQFFPHVGLGIQPEEWERVGHYFTFTTHGGDGGSDAETEVDMELELPPCINQRDFEREFNALEGARCGCCNHKIKRGAFFHNNSRNQLIYVGFDCSQNIMRYRFDVAGAKKQTLKQRKERLKIEAIEAAFAKHEGLEAALLDGEYNGLVRDIRDRLLKWGNISDKQVELVMRIAAQRREFVQVAQPVPVGKFEGELEIVSAKVYYDNYAERYNQAVVLQSGEGGWRVWVKNFMRLEGNNEAEFVKRVGDKVRVRMQIEGNERDAYFGFGKRCFWK